MNTLERIKMAMSQAINEVNQQLLEEQQVEKSDETILIGSEAKIDSLALVNLIVAIEEKISDEFGTNISLVNDTAMMQDESPFRTIKTFTDYISQLLGGQGIE
jgi:acyl carrier protein